MEEKIMHGKYLRQLDEQLVEKQESVAWLRGAGLKGETESLLVGAQNQVLKTNFIMRAEFYMSK